MMNRTGQATVRLEKALWGFWGQNIQFHAFVPAVLCLALIWPFGGGWKTVHMMAGTTTPGARGEIKFKTSSNENTAMQIETAHLAPPSSLTPPENAYVVWIRSPGQSPQNLGQLKVNSKEQGSLATETAYKRFSLFITAEQNPRIQAPAGPTVLSADVTE